MTLKLRNIKKTIVAYYKLSNNPTRCDSVYTPQGNGLKMKYTVLIGIL